MKQPVRSFVVAIVLVLGLSLVGPPGAAAGPPGAPAAAEGKNGDAERFRGKKVVRFTIFETGQVTPWRIFFVANSGPYLRNLRWEGWGSKKAVGRGWYRSDCASCSPPARRKAKITLSKRAWCATRGVYYYKRAVMVRKPSAGQKRRVRVDGAPCPTE